LERLSHARNAEIVYQRDLASIETGKFKNMVDAIGTTTLEAIATAGPDMQVRNSFVHV
jgi:major vault protein